MYFINPFKALRPNKENASSVTIASTDHLSEDMKRDHLKKNPWSYLNVFNAENKKKSKEQFELMKNKSIIITGAASGMGAASARKFSKSGANVTIVDINEDLAFQVANEIKTADPIIGDIGDSSFCNKVIESTIERYGKVDVLVNCAGTILRANAENTTDDDWHRVMLSLIHI